MKLGGHLRLLFGVLMATQVVTSLAGIGLLERMSPAIGKILQENVASVEAVEVMLSVLGRPAPDRAARARFHEALEAAEGNVTEAEETELLRRVRTGARQALGGDLRARVDVLDALSSLGSTNRQAMHRADREARRLGSAGRWALAFLAVTGLAASLLAFRRTRSSLLAPLVELRAVTIARRSGDLHRRCRPFPENEISEILDMMNRLLDRAHEDEAPDHSRQLASLRAALVGLLDRGAGPQLLLDEQGSLLAASDSAMAQMSARGDEILSALRTETSDDAIVEVISLTRQGLRLVRLDPEA